jgi:hypothetical protein
VNYAGETTLHAIALDKNPNLLYRQVVRGVNPLSLTKRGHSVLLYAVKNPHCPRRMVGECIRLGFSTHQPALTQLQEDIAAQLTEFIEHVFFIEVLVFTQHRRYCWLWYTG